MSSEHYATVDGAPWVPCMWMHADGTWARWLKLTRTGCCAKDQLVQFTAV